MTQPPIDAVQQRTIDELERASLTAADFLAAGVEMPRWSDDPVPSLETWRAWTAAENQAMAHKRAARGGGG